MVSNEELTQALNYYEKKIPVPFIVLFIKSSEDFDLFVNATIIGKMNTFSYLVIFDTRNQELMDICRNPGKNYFNLVFDAEMLVICLNQDVPIREWYSLYENETKVMDYGTWTRDGGLVLKNHKSLYERRNSLDGITLKVTSMKVSNIIKTVVAIFFNLIFTVLASHSMNAFSSIFLLIVLIQCIAQTIFLKVQQLHQ